MEMKDRVDGFLKVAAERISADMGKSDIRWQLNDLMGSLMELLDDEAEKDRLHKEYNKVLKAADIAIWDERFLRVIANDDEEREVPYRTGFGQAPQRPRQGAPITYPTIPGTGTTTLTTSAPLNSATWSTTATTDSNKISLSQTQMEALVKEAKEKGLI